MPNTAHNIQGEASAHPTLRYVVSNELAAWLANKRKRDELDFTYSGTVIGLREKLIGKWGTEPSEVLREFYGLIQTVTGSISRAARGVLLELWLGGQEESIRRIAELEAAGGILLTLDIPVEAHRTLTLTFIVRSLDIENPDQASRLELIEKLQGVLDQKAAELFAAIDQNSNKAMKIAHIATATIYDLEVVQQAIGNGMAVIPGTQAVVSSVASRRAAQVRALVTEKIVPIANAKAGLAAKTVIKPTVQAAHVGVKPHIAGTAAATVHAKAPVAAKAVTTGIVPVATKVSVQAQVKAGTANMAVPTGVQAGAAITAKTGVTVTPAAAKAVATGIVAAVTKAAVQAQVKAGTANMVVPTGVQAGAAIAAKTGATVMQTGTTVQAGMQVKATPAAAVNVAAKQGMTVLATAAQSGGVIPAAQTMAAKAATTLAATVVATAASAAPLSSFAAPGATGQSRTAMMTTIDATKAVAAPFSTRSVSTPVNVMLASVNGVPVSQASAATTIVAAKDATKAVAAAFSAQPVSMPMNVVPAGINIMPVSQSAAAAVIGNVIATQVNGSASAAQVRATTPQNAVPPPVTNFAAPILQERQRFATGSQVIVADRQSMQTVTPANVQTVTADKPTAQSAAKAIRVEKAPPAEDRKSNATTAAKTVERTAGRDSDTEARNPSKTAANIGIQQGETVRTEAKQASDGEKKDVKKQFKEATDEKCKNCTGSCPGCPMGKMMTKDVKAAMISAAHNV